MLIVAVAGSFVSEFMETLRATGAGWQIHWCEADRR